MVLRVVPCGVDTSMAATCMAASELTFCIVEPTPCPKFKVFVETSAAEVDNGISTSMEAASRTGILLKSFVDTSSSTKSFFSKVVVGCVNFTSLIVIISSLVTLVLWRLIGAGPRTRTSPPILNSALPPIVVTVNPSPSNNCSINFLFSFVSSMTFESSTAMAPAGSLPISIGMSNNSHSSFNSSLPKSMYWTRTPNPTLSLRTALYISPSSLNLVPYTAPFFILCAGFNSSLFLANLSINELILTSSLILDTHTFFTLSTCTTITSVSTPCSNGGQGTNLIKRGIIGSPH